MESIKQGNELKPFTAFTYRTIDGETITATKNNSIVTLNGDKKGVRQLPLDQFWQEFMATVPKVDKTPEKDTVTFKGQEDCEKKEAGSGKKWGVGIASFFLPGLGQAINGDWGKGVGFLLGITGLTMGGRMLVRAGKMGAGLAAAVAGLGTCIWSIVDAIKNAKAD